MQREAWRIDKAGALDRLTRRSEPLEDPGPDEARVRVHAIGLNFADVFACLGLYSATPAGSFVPGLEVAGEVEALGPWTGPAPVARGDRVIALTRFGGYATHVNARLRVLRPLPRGWSFADGAAWPVQGLTAWYGLVRLGALDVGHAVLVQSAAGGVGLQALSLIEALGAVAVGIVGSGAKRDFLAARGLPLERIIVRHRRTFDAALDAALASIGRPGFDLVFDAVGGPYLLPAFRRLVPEGRLVVYGGADFMPAGSRPSRLRLAWQYLRRPRLDPLRMMSRNRSVMAFNLIWLWDRLDRLAEAYAALEPLSPSAPHVGARYPFAELPAALRHLQSGRSVGKVVVEV